MKPRILIIDDEKETRDLFVSFLEGNDYEIQEAANGQEALNLVNSGTFDLYVTDVFMPEINGIEFLKILKTLDPDAVVIIVTGYDNMEYTKQALEYGAFRFLAKPVKLVDFRSIVELGLAERSKLFHTDTSEKLARMKRKLSTNAEMRVKITNKFHDFLQQMEKYNPSFIEIGGPGSRGKIWGKFYSTYKPIPAEISFTQEEVNIMILSILSETQIEVLMDKKTIKTNYEFRDNNTFYRYRITVYFDRDQLVLGIKTTRRSIISLSQMKFSETVLSKMTFKNENAGLVIISGPPGSGKSSLIDAVVNLNNCYLSGSIFMIADSLEYFHESKNCMIRHQKLYRDVNTVPEGLEQCLTYNPNMVVIEDITTPEILEGVLKLVDTGCLVVATLKNRSVTEVFYKLLSFYSPESQEMMIRHLARTLELIICQQLIPSIHKKMIAVKEILVNSDEVAQFLYSGNIEEMYPFMQRNRKMGLQTLEQDLLTYLKAGQISRETALGAANRNKTLKDMIKFS